MEHPKNKLDRLEKLVKQTENSQVQTTRPVFPDDNINNPVDELEKRKRRRGRPKGSQNKNIGFRQKDKEAMKKAAKVLWEKGMVTWKLDKAQQDLVKAFNDRGDQNELVWVLPRQFGKSYAIAAILIEECINKPNLRVAYVTPLKSMARDIVEKNFLQILTDCPENKKCKFDTQRGCWKFPNGSMIKVAGMDGNHIDSVRGNTFDIIVVDEAGFGSPTEFEYSLKDVLKPTMTRADKPVMVLITTPPKNYDHPFNDYWDDAKTKGTLIFRTIYQSSLSKERIAFIENDEGKESVTFRRERLCERIADSSTLVVPEATKEKIKEIVKEWDRPEFFKAYTSADYGVLDLNAILYGYHDFVNNKLVIEDESVLSGEEFDTQRMAKAITEKEAELWGEDKKVLRYCDNNLQIIRDFANLYNLSFLATPKDNKQAAINAVRMKIQNLEIVIHPRCVNLINHIQNAVWDKNRKQFRRALGHHYDFLDALIYMVRNVDYNHNPFPPDYGLDGKYLSPKFLHRRKVDAGNNFEEFMNNLMQIRKTGRRR